MPPPSDLDRRYMALALRLAERGLGRTWPNPPVGCVVVRNGRIVGRGWTQPPPGNHAEVEALNRAGPAAVGATAYVTLEPCCHYGRTPPCTMALIHAGIRRVVTAATDPFPRVDGRGIDQLRQAGMQVDVGLMRAEAEAHNAGFLLSVSRTRPLVTLKLATSLDGRIATRSGESQWITGAAARARGHRLRATHDAIMVGTGTALADDPALTCRLPGLEHQSPVRVVLDRLGRLPLSSRLVRTARATPLWMVTSDDVPDETLAEHRAAGVEVLIVGLGADRRLDLASVMRALSGRGVTRLLVEGGAALAASLLRAKLVDRLAWFQAPMVIGGDGRPAIDDLSIDRLAETPTFERKACEVLASDVGATYITRKP
jgi:diaminohydroxyphosphoribosylaminopyrimidine deaminase/5-amino-6-(5-phosphoribosylamino)uracil reductase